MPKRTDKEIHERLEAAFKELNAALSEADASDIKVDISCISAAVFGRVLTRQMYSFKAYKALG